MTVTTDSSPARAMASVALAAVLVLSPALVAGGAVASSASAAPGASEGDLRTPDESLTLDDGDSPAWVDDVDEDALPGNAVLITVCYNESMAPLEGSDWDPVIDKMQDALPDELDDGREPNINRSNASLGYSWPAGTVDGTLYVVNVIPCLDGEDGDENLDEDTRELTKHHEYGHAHSYGLLWKAILCLNENGHEFDNVSQSWTNVTERANEEYHDDVGGNPDETPDDVEDQDDHVEAAEDAVEDALEAEFDDVDWEELDCFDDLFATAPDLNGDGELATDTTGDGLLNDADGDGTFDIFDVQVLFDNLDSDALQEYADSFDFSEDGSVDIFDVQALFEDLQGNATPAGART